jgi:hypothetical protein
LLARFPVNEETVRQLVATDAIFDALCDEYRTVSRLLDGVEVEANGTGIAEPRWKKNC